METLKTSIINIEENDMLLISYLKSSINGLYKILPLKEENNKDLVVYISSLRLNLIGVQYNYPRLKYNSDFLSVVNILTYLINNDFDVTICKREVFKSIRLIRKIITKIERK